MSAGLDPVREHLDAAETWLANAEEYRSELAKLEPDTAPSDGYAFRVTAVRDQSGVLLSSAIQLAELHRAMAQTYWDVTPQRYALAEEPEARSAEEVQRLVREQLEADDDAHQGETLRPGVDDEPPGDGELWTTGDGWFYYAVAPASGQLAPTYTEAPRWLLVRHYAQVLRWSSEQGAKPAPYTWDQVRYTRAPGEGEVVLRRPTTEERTAFYGPEPDSEVSAQAEREGPLPPANPDQWVGGVVPRVCPNCEGRHVGDCAEAPPATLGEAFRTPYSATAKAAEAGDECGRCAAGGLPGVPAVTLNARNWPRCARCHALEVRDGATSIRPAPEDRGMFRDRG